ncbi:DUF397 domain-containing protein [Streptomyces sp. ME02-6991-2A]|nr:DUF397 domain-containing protein [Streptomyces sp. ME02-6991-2A]
MKATRLAPGAAAWAGAEASFAIRDSKPEGAGKELRFTEAELDDFAAGWVRTRSLTPPSRLR